MWSSSPDAKYLPHWDIDIDLTHFWWKLYSIDNELLSIISIKDIAFETDSNSSRNLYITDYVILQGKNRQIYFNKMIEYIKKITKMKIN